jgi:hypothetical protein
VPVSVAVSVDVAVPVAVAVSVSVAVEVCGEVSCCVDVPLSDCAESFGSGVQARRRARARVTGAPEFAVA